METAVRKWIICVNMEQVFLHETLEKCQCLHLWLFQVLFWRKIFSATDDYSLVYYSESVGL